MNLGCCTCNDFTWYTIFNRSNNIWLPYPQLALSPLQTASYIQLSPRASEHCDWSSDSAIQYEIFARIFQRFVSCAISAAIAIFHCLNLSRSSHGKRNFKSQIDYRCDILHQQCTSHTFKETEEITRVACIKPKPVILDDPESSDIFFEHSLSACWYCDNRLWDYRNFVPL